MRVRMRIPLELSQSLIARTDRSASEYEAMANGLIEGNHLLIHCEERAADALVSWADNCVKGARQQIEVLRGM